MCFSPSSFENEIKSEFRLVPLLISFCRCRFSDSFFVEFINWIRANYFELILKNPFNSSGAGFCRPTDNSNEQFSAIIITGMIYRQIVRRTTIGNWTTLCRCTKWMSDLNIVLLIIILFQRKSWTANIQDDRNWTETRRQTIEGISATKLLRGKLSVQLNYLPTACFGKIDKTTWENNFERKNNNNNNKMFIAPKRTSETKEKAEEKSIFQIIFHDIIWD